MRQTAEYINASGLTPSTKVLKIILGARPFEILTECWPDAMIESMPVAEQKRFVRRPPRVCFLQPEPITLIIGNKKLSVGLYKVSVTGGVLQVPDAVFQAGFATVALKTSFGVVSSPIEFLRTPVPGKRNAVPFRFFNMDSAHRDRLDQAVGQLCQKGFGEKQNGTWVQSLLRLIQRQ